MCRLDLTEHKASFFCVLLSMATHDIRMGKDFTELLQISGSHPSSLGLIGSAVPLCGSNKATDNIEVFLPSLPNPPSPFLHCCFFFKLAALQHSVL